jgi:hypothetical protein
VRGARFRSSMGRELPDGVGIVPDLMVRRDAYTAGERAFLDSLGSNYAAFRSALQECAERSRGNAELTSEAFTVTPAMREEVRAALLERGVHLSPAVMDGAAGYVDRQLGYEIARTVFGDPAAIRRRLMDDRQMRTAMDLLQRDLSQPELIRVAEQGVD